ncbi:MAG: DUF916 domain-containing protein [Jatrophihabitans sp.]|uniref:DUF916 domain-containing protein n=1 Tax=Jatrophihabitans sp. TaxID=1932789 RepID=UPI003F7E2339
MSPHRPASRARRLFGAVVLLSSAMTVAVGAVPSVAAAPHGPTTPKNATFGIGPASSKGIDGRPYLNYVSDPGGTLTDHIAVSNYGTIPVTLHLYPADAVSTAGGAIGFDPAAHPGTDARQWITFPGGVHDLSVHLAPRQARIIPIRGVIPADASPGDHVVGIMAGYTAEVSGRNGRIAFEQRVALRALFRISGDVRSRLAVTSLHVDYRTNWNPFGSGSATVTFDVRNDGNVLLAGQQKVQITGVLGGSGTVHKLAQLPLLLPGATTSQRVTVRDVTPEILMHARVTVTPLGVRSAVDPVLAPTSATTSFWAVPWSLLLLVVLAGLGLVLYRRRRRGPRPARTPGRPTSDAPQLVDA